MSESDGLTISSRSVLALVAALCFIAAGCAARGPSRPATVASPQGVHHPLDAGLTLYALSRTYRVPVSTLMKANGITDPSTIPAGTPIFIPGARSLLEVPVSVRPALAWPLAGTITSGFRSRGGSHRGLDIDGEKGDPIRAAASGTVLRAGKDGRYGLSIVIGHGKGIETLYAHASVLLVREGDRVERSQEIARVGQSGNARGTHLHFEVRLDGKAVNPGAYLQTPSHRASRD